MTAHKHFKKLVRSRMAKTGESYSAARRQLLGKLDRQAEVPSARWHFAGSIPAATALRCVLTAAGLRHPKTREPLSEELVYGIAGGIGMGVASFYYAAEDHASLFLAGRHRWHDDQQYIRETCSRIAIEPVVTESSGGKTAEKQLRELTASHGACIAWVDSASLPHRGMPAQFSGGGYHVVTVYKVDDEAGTATIGDLTDDVVTLPLTALTAARGRIKKDKHRLLAVPEIEDVPDVRDLIMSGLAACHRAMNEQPFKGQGNMFGLNALKQWGDRIHGSKDKLSWDLVFKSGQNLWRGLTGIHDYIENYGTGGGLGRPTFSAFLAEAATLTGDVRLDELARRYAELGDQWSALADAALPRSVPAFAAIRDLYARRAEVMTAGGPDGPTEASQVWREIMAVGEANGKAFPMTAAESSELRASLQERIRNLHAGEVAAHAALGTLVG